jgi:hypothetical protein
MKHMKRSKHKSRGVAMVEAVVLMPVLIVFLGSFMYVKTLFDQRMGRQNQTHKKSSEEALKSCQGGGATGLITGCKGRGVNLGLAESDKKSSGTITVHVGRVDSDDTKTTLSSEVNAHSTRLCDEKPENGTPLGMIKKAASLVYDAREGPSGDATGGEGCTE